MKNFIKIIVIFFTCYASANASKGVDVNITLTVSKSGGTNYLNTKTKLNDGGELRYTLKGECETIIEHIYKINIDKNHNRQLFVTLIRKQKGHKEVKWTKDIPVPKDGRLIFDPFEKVKMQIEVKAVDIRA